MPQPGVGAGLQSLGGSANGTRSEPATLAGVKAIGPLIFVLGAMLLAASPHAATG